MFPGKGIKNVSNVKEIKQVSFVWILKLGTEKKFLNFLFGS
jgi:hypothetical protein